MLYLVRHAIAAEPGPEYPDDSRRPLTAHGIERFRECVAGLAAAAIEIDEIVTSPFVRARQTAGLLAEGLAGRPRITTLRALAMGGSPAEVIDGLARGVQARSMALVGHMPGIGDLTARLVGARRGFDFRKGAIACVELDGLPPRGPGTLRWFMPPRLLRRLGGRT